MGGEPVCSSRSATGPTMLPRSRKPEAQPSARARKKMSRMAKKRLLSSRSCNADRIMTQAPMKLASDEARAIHLHKEKEKGGVL